MSLIPDQRNTPPQPPARDVLSVSSLNRLARSLLEGNFPAVTVEGEISNLAVPASGHWYLTLKDSSAQIRCAMFRNRNMSVRFRPANGMQVVVRGKLSIYEGRGDYQLILDTVEEAGAGALQRAFERLKAKLESEGLFDELLKQAMPEHIRHVGVITSATGAAIRDILSVFARRFPAITITILPVAVQGAEAPAAIVEALKTANRRARELGLDVLIVGRGGGSLEDLQAFNEESVARAIFASKLPVVSAVGHEVDFTIADFVADLRAPTPSAAAELLSPDQEEYFQWFAGYEQNLFSLISQHLQNSRKTLKALLRHLKHPGRKLQEHAQTLDRLEQQLQRAVRQQLAKADNALRQNHSRLLLHSPAATLRQQQVQQQNLTARLHKTVRQELNRHRSGLSELARSLESVSPLQTLHRGYSITRDSTGRVVRTTDSLKPGQRIATQLESGKIFSEITELEP